jgi:hypothetical protein
MRKEALILCVLLLASVLLLGCTSSGQPNQQGATSQAPVTPANNTPNPKPNTPANNTPAVTPGQNSISENQLYKLGSVKSYTYRLTTGTGGQQTEANMSNSVSSDTVNGVDAWLQETQVTMTGVAVDEKMWVDKATNVCLNVTTTMTYNGQTSEQPSTCPTTGLYSTASEGANSPSLTYVGQESVTVPAGTFTANKYSLNTVTYWLTSSVPVPLKISSGTAVMELVSYS